MEKIFNYRYKNRELALNFKEKIDEDLGYLIDIAACDDKELLLIYNGFLNIDLDSLMASQSFKEEAFRILMDMDRFKRVVTTRNGNFGAITLENDKIKKYTYDKKGERTSKYLKDNKLEQNYMVMDLLEDKTLYKYRKCSFLASTELIEVPGYFVAIEYLYIDKNSYNKNKETGDLVNIYVIDDNKKVTKYENFFISLDKSLLYIDEAYKEYVANVLVNDDRNRKALESKNAYLGIITKEETPIKMSNSKAITNIKKEYSIINPAIIDYTNVVVENA